MWWSNQFEKTEEEPRVQIGVWAVQMKSMTIAFGGNCMLNCSESLQ
jgi:hypothetical protein